jgi:hypothetical protein
VAAGTSAEAGATQQAAAGLAAMAKELWEPVGSFRY